MRWRHALIPLLLAAIVMISRQQLRDVVAVLLRLLRPAARFGGQARANREQFDRDVHTFGLRSPSLTVDERKLKMRQLNAASPSRLLNVHMHSWASFQNASQPHTSQAEPWCDGEPEPVAGSRDPFRIYAQLFTWLEAHGAKGISNVCLRHSIDRGISLAAAREIASPFIFALPADLLVDSARSITRGHGWLADAHAREQLKARLPSLADGSIEHNFWQLTSLLLAAEADLDAAGSDARAAAMGARAATSVERAHGVPPPYLDVMLAQRAGAPTMPLWWLLFPTTYARTLGFVRQSTEILRELMSAASRVALEAARIGRVHSALLDVLAGDGGGTQPPLLSSRHIGAICDPWRVAAAMVHVRSRAFGIRISNGSGGTGGGDGPGSTLLVPLLDLGNHPDDGESNMRTYNSTDERWFAVSPFRWRAHDTSGRVVVQPGTELTNNYMSAECNPTAPWSECLQLQEWLSSYGFVPERAMAPGAWQQLQDELAAARRHASEDTAAVGDWLAEGMREANGWRASSHGACVRRSAMHDTS